MYHVQSKRHQHCKKKSSYHYLKQRTKLYSSFYSSCIDYQAFRFNELNRFRVGQKHVGQDLFNFHHCCLDLKHVLFTLFPFAPGIPNRVIVLVVIVEGQYRLSSPGGSHTDIGEGRNVEDLLVNANETRHAIQFNHSLEGFPFWRVGQSIDTQRKESCEVSCAIELQLCSLDAMRNIDSNVHSDTIRFQ